MRERQILIWVLRLFGGSTCLALPASLLPTDWMAATHAWLGLGAFPRSPLVEYLTRSIALLYAIHGGMLLLASTDVRRFAPFIIYLAVADGLMGVLLVVIDAYARMPWFWTALEGPSVTVASALLLWLNHRASASR